VAMPAARPADRYGDRGRRRSWALWLGISGLLVATGVGLLLFRASTDAVRSGLVAWETPADEVLPVTLEVVRRPGTEVTCDLVAVDIRRVVVGQVSVQIPTSDEWRTRVDAEIPLQGDAVAPELRECEAADRR
jgi:Domain of unknown function (DUF4307)